MQTFSDILRIRMDSQVLVWRPYRVTLHFVVIATASLSSTPQKNMGLFFKLLPLDGERLLLESLRFPGRFVTVARTRHSAYSLLLCNVSDHQPSATEQSMFTFTQHQRGCDVTDVQDTLSDKQTDQDSLEDIQDILDAANNQAV